MPDENQHIAITMERLLDLTNYIIDHMVNDAGGHVREVIENLSDLAPESPLKFIKECQ